MTSIIIEVEGMASSIIYITHYAFHVMPLYLIRHAFILVSKELYAPSITSWVLCISDVIKCYYGLAPRDIRAMTEYHDRLECGSDCQES